MAGQREKPASDEPDKGLRAMGRRTERSVTDHFRAIQVPRLATVPAGQVFTSVLGCGMALNDSQQAPRIV